ncbi:MAG: hypothetical protein V7636_1918 [Actinomycetota bacterium]
MSTETAGEPGEPTARVPQTAWRASNHLRRYMPLYVFGTIWALMLALLPTVTHNGSDDGSQVAAFAPGASDASGSGGTSGGSGTGGATDTGPTAPGTGGAPSTGGTSGGGGGGGGTVQSAAVGQVEAGTGTTVGGYPCTKGARQIPYSQYADPCLAKYEGGNGGATWNGVTADTIKIIIRVPSDASGPNAQAVNKVSEQAGQATSDQAYQYATDMLPLFNKTFELYGRKVELVKFNGQGNGTDEAQSKGQEAACADANAIASSVHGFGVVGWGFGYMSQPFSECAKQYKLFVPLGAPYFPEDTYYKRWDPYVWAGTMECTRIAHDVAEYVGKRLANRNAKWAGDLTYQKTKRKFATYVPDNPGYGHCVSITQSDMKNKYNVDPGDRYNYALDVSQFPSEAERGVIQFHAAGDTTLINACDPLSTIFLTQSASSQNWHPEWFIIGVAAQDTDGYARLWDQGEVDGHLFGLSQLGSDRKVQAKDGEAAQFYKQATGHDMPSGAALIYYFMMQLFNQLQAAGPTLTPQNIGNATHALPPAGGANGAAGTWDFSDDHTAINDSREVYWDGSATSFDGKSGDYVETYGGKRFSSGQWPAEEPPVYPKK